MKFNTFCAANSGDGFISFFDSILDERTRQVYYIKGGPGCGKSTLMKELAAVTDHAELIHCSGDPHSLDGVILPMQKTVIIDATTPHSHEPTYPGVGGCIVDLGIGWDRLKLNKEAVIKLIDTKKNIYSDCYSLLKGAKELYKGVFLPLQRALDVNKIKGIADKILRQYALWGRQENPAKVRHRFLSAITSEGYITYNETFDRLSKNIILLEDRWMLSNVLLQYIHQYLSENGIDHIACHHPLLGKEVLHHLIIPSVELSLVSNDGIFPLDLAEEKIARKIVLQSFLDKAYINDHKVKLTFIKRLLRSILDTATEKLADSKELHMKLEAEYAKGIDFTRIDTIKEILKNNIFG